MRFLVLSACVTRLDCVTKAKEFLEFAIYHSIGEQAIKTVADNPRISRGYYIEGQENSCWRKGQKDKEEEQRWPRIGR